MISKFNKAKSEMKKYISKSEIVVDPSHAENTLKWLLVLKPDADEVLQLAAFGHDIERSMPDRCRAEMFASYDEYKNVHAQKGAIIASTILARAGYDKQECHRIEELIRNHEVYNTNADSQLLSDADTISYFDNNATEYAQRKGQEIARKKIKFMLGKASPRAKKHIKRILAHNE